jgi:galactokinase
MNNEIKEKAFKLKNSFQDIFKKAPQIYVYAPGRVNLIGEHTDYNEGYVLPAAINLQIIVLSTPRNDKIINLYSHKFKSFVSIPINSISHNKKEIWSNYEIGVAKMLIDSGYKLGGADILVGGDVPINAGLSSSAAVEVATAHTFKELFNLNISNIEIVKLCQKVENEFVGVGCGIMDQFASCLSRKNFAIFLDCRSLEFEYIPFKTDQIKIFLANTNIERALIGSEYNKRRKESAEGAKILSKYISGVKSLRDVNLEDFNKYKHHLPENIRKRCEHVINENQRVIDSIEGLKNDSILKLGELMWESHQSLRDLYEVSSKELDIMVDIAKNTEGVLGSRLLGGGFGGCTISIVKNESMEKFKENITRDYIKKTGIQPEIYICDTEDGAKKIEGI